MTLSKEHLVRKIASINGYPKHESSQLLESLLELMKSTFESGEDIMISGFGKFQVKDKKNRRGINPRKTMTYLCRPGGSSPLLSSEMISPNVFGLLKTGDCSAV
ncbi:MAG: HU family DNA-binding protein [Deltaproteobacteria bacterium]|nr:HU family DNA-binding protein [Deltaproteobacteria bacterium]MCF8118902.1 HU family DNA-binding protein [Deltaproteobacteria bacterium]